MQRIILSTDCLIRASIRKFVCVRACTVPLRTALRPAPVRRATFTSPKVSASSQETYHLELIIIEQQCHST